MGTSNSRSTGDREWSPQLNVTITPALVNAGIFLGECDAPVAPVTKPCIPIEICFIKAIYPFYPEKYCSIT